MWYAVIAIMSVVAVMAAMNWMMEATPPAAPAETEPEAPEEGVELGRATLDMPAPEVAALAQLLGEARGLVAELRAALETAARTADDERRTAEAVLGPVRANVDEAEERESDELTVVAARPGPVAVPPPQSSGLRLASEGGVSLLQVLAALDGLAERSGRVVNGAEHARRLLRLGTNARWTPEGIVETVNAVAQIEDVATYTADELIALITARLLGLAAPRRPSATTEDPDHRAASLPPAAA